MARQVTNRELVANSPPTQREARSETARGGPVRDWHAAIERAFEAGPLPAKIAVSTDWPRIARQVIGYGALVTGYGLVALLILA